MWLLLSKFTVHIFQLIADGNERAVELNSSLNDLVQVLQKTSEVAATTDKNLADVCTNVVGRFTTKTSHNEATRYAEVWLYSLKPLMLIWNLFLQSFRFFCKRPQTYSNDRRLTTLRHHRQLQQFLVIRVRETQL